MLNKPNINTRKKEWTREKKNGNKTSALINFWMVAVLVYNIGEKSTQNIRHKYFIERIQKVHAQQKNRRWRRIIVVLLCFVFANKNCKTYERWKCFLRLVFFSSIVHHLWWALAKFKKIRSKQKDYISINIGIGILWMYFVHLLGCTPYFSFQSVQYNRLNNTK